MLEAESVVEFLSKVDLECLVVVDAAYQEYAAYKDSKRALEAKKLIEAFPNVLFLGTFSKAFGLGGMRVGYGVAQKEIIAALHKMRAPFNITTLSLVAAIEALKDWEHVRVSLEENLTEMRRYEDFARVHGIAFISSYTNFMTLLLDGFRVDSARFSQSLLEQGVIVRNLASYGMNAVRVTIGRPWENDRFFELALPLAKGE